MKQATTRRLQNAAAEQPKEARMPEDAARSATHATTQGADPGTDLADLRRAAAEFARTLKAYGLERIGAVEEEVEEGSEALMREGWRVARDLRARMAAAEAKIERNIKDHPGTWLGGLLGAIGFGLVLGMILRRRD